MINEVKTYGQYEIKQNILTHFKITEIELSHIGNEFARSMYIYCLYLFGGFSPVQVSQYFAEPWWDITKIIQDVQSKCLADKNYQKSVIEIESLFE